MWCVHHGSGERRAGEGTEPEVQNEQKIVGRNGVEDRPERQSDEGIECVETEEVTTGRVSPTSSRLRPPRRPASTRCAT